LGEVEKVTALPASMAGRFGDATTWGEAVMSRIGNQNTAYRSLFPEGSLATGVGMTMNGGKMLELSNLDVQVKWPRGYLAHRKARASWT
jgi:hypothetical protein